jgi:hypothetical protein
MALHTDLPIYKLTYQLMLLSVELTRSMPRDFKPTIGRKINEECLNLTVLVFRANCSQDKAPYLDRLLERVQVTELLFRLSKDMRFVSVAQYAKVIELTDMIGRQANGWRKQSATAPATSPSRRRGLSDF